MFHNLEYRGSKARGSPFQNSGGTETLPVAGAALTFSAKPLSPQSSSLKASLSPLAARIAVLAAPSPKISSSLLSLPSKVQSSVKSSSLSTTSNRGPEMPGFLAAYFTLFLIFNSLLLSTPVLASPTGETNSSLADPVSRGLLITVRDLHLDAQRDVASLVVTMGEPVVVRCSYHSNGSHGNEGMMVEWVRRRAGDDGGKDETLKPAASYLGLKVEQTSDNESCKAILNFQPVTTKLLDIYICRLNPALSPGKDLSKASGGHETGAEVGQSMDIELGMLEVTLEFPRHPGEKLNITSNVNSRTSSDGGSDRKVSELAVQLAFYNCQDSYNGSNTRHSDSQATVHIIDEDVCKNTSHNVTHGDSPYQQKQQQPINSALNAEQSSVSEDESSLLGLALKQPSPSNTSSYSTTQKPLTSSIPVVSTTTASPSKESDNLSTADKTTNVEQDGNAKASIALSTERAVATATSGSKEKSETERKPPSITTTKQQATVATVKATEATVTSTTEPLINKVSSSTKQTGVVNDVLAPSTPVAEPMSDRHNEGKAGLVIVILLAVMAAGACTAAILYRRRNKGKKSAYITFGNPSYGKDNLPANDYGLDSPLTLSSNGYTVLA